MSRGVLESANRSLAIQINPGGLPNLIAKLDQLRFPKHCTYMLKERALLVEFKKPACLQHALAHLRVRQPFVHYPVLTNVDASYEGSPANSDSTGRRASDSIDYIVRLRRQLKLDIVPDFNWQSFRSELLTEKSISSQILTYYNKRLLDKSHVILRTVLATGINSLIQSVSAGVALKIVGSLRTGTSFEKSDCDMNLWFYDNCCPHLNRGDFLLKACPEPERLRECLEALLPLKIVSLRNQHPVGFSSPTFPNRVFLAHLGLLLRDIDPCVVDLQCHTGAQVPVIRAKHAFLGFHFDISLNSRYNHKLNFLISALNDSCPPFTPLLIAIKGICKESRFRMIEADDYSGQLTTFKLTALLIYFLQGCGYVPPLSRLLSLISNPSQVQAYSNLPAAESNSIRDSFTRNARNLETLLKQFLRFLITYDFADKGLDLLNFLEIPRTQLPKSMEHDALVVLNPTADAPINVTRNIRSEDWKRHCAIFEHVLNHLESQTDRDSDSWGLVGLFDFPETSLGEPECDQLQRVLEKSNRMAAHF